MFKHTLKQLEVIQKKELDRLLKYAGGPSPLGKMLHVNRSVVQGWLDRERISKKGAKLVDRHGTLNKLFDSKKLRPDL